jgi:hypothetical protein
MYVTKPEQGGGLDPRTAIEGSFSAWRVSENQIAGAAAARLFFPDSRSDRDSDKTFQISRNLGLEHVEFFVSSIHSLVVGRVKGVWLCIVHPPTSKLGRRIPLSQSRLYPPVSDLGFGLSTHFSKNCTII